MDSLNLTSAQVAEIKRRIMFIDNRIQQCLSTIMDSTDSLEIRAIQKSYHQWCGRRLELLFLIGEEP